MGIELQQVICLESLRHYMAQCAVCDGTGKVRYPDNQGNEYEDSCPACDGIGWLPQEYVPALFVSESNSD